MPIPFLNKTSYSSTLTLNGSGNYIEGVNSIPNQSFKLESDASGNGALTLANTSGVSQVFFNGAGSDNYILGNVGIGTASPSAALHVYDQGSGEVKFQRATGYAGLLHFGFPSGLPSIRTSGNFAIKASNAWGADLYINSSGNVGIGTDNPIVPLHVSGAAVNDPSNGTGGYEVMQIFDTTSYATGVGGGIGFGGNFTSSNNTIFSEIRGLKENATNSNYAGALSFSTRLNGANITERMRIDSAGNVGIGTTSPAFPLEVENASTAYVFSETTGAATSSGYRWKTPDSEFAWFSTGGTNALNLYDYVAGATRMIIDSSGNLKLNAYGAGYLKTDGNGAVTAESGIPGTGTFLPLTGGTLSGPGNLTVGGTLSVTGITTLNGQANVGSVVPRIDSTFSLGSNTLRFASIYGDGLTITNNATFGGNGSFTGNVGIGVTAHSTYALDIQGTSGLALRFYNGTTFKSGIAAVTTAGEMIAGSAVDDFAIRANAGNMLFATNGNVERLRLDTSGNAIFAGSVTINSTGFTKGGHKISNYFATDSADGEILNLGVTGNIGYIQSLDGTTTNTLTLDGSSVVFRTGSFLTALTLDASQNATFAGGTIIKGNGVVYLGYTDSTAIGGNKLEVNGNIYGSGNATFAGDVTLNGEIYGRTSAAYPGLGGLGFYSLVPYLENANQGGLKIQVQAGASLVDALTLDSSQNATFGTQAFATTATSSGDGSSTLTTKGYVDSLITGATIYRGTWQAGISATSTGTTTASTTLTVSAAILDAAGNTPTLVGAVVTGAGITGTVKVSSVTSSTVYVLDTAIDATATAYIFSPIYGAPDLSGVTQTSGYYYICSEAGSATPNGAGTEPNTWGVGDWVIWNDDVGASGEWQKVDNSSVLSGAGTGQTVALWEGPSSVTDSETLGNAPITVSGNNSTFAGNVELKSNAGGATKFLRIWNEGTVDASDDAVLTWQTQASRSYSMGIHRDSGNLVISNADISVASGDIINITNAGNVGIGDTTPSFPLVISKSSSTASMGADLSMRLSLTNPDQTNNNLALITFGDGTSQPGSGFFGMQFTDHTNNYGELVFGTRGVVGYSEKMRIDSEGNVGIGTTVAVGRLTVANPSADDVIDYTKGIVFVDTTASNEDDPWVHASIVAMGSTQYNGNLIFATDGNGSRSSDTSGLTERMRIFSNGNVNIGVAETGSSAVTGPFVVTHSSSRFLTSSFEEGTVSLSAKNNNNNLESLRLAGDSIKFFNGTNTVGSQKMVILSSGNVGIGVTGPVTKLELPGSTTNSSIKAGTLELQSYSVNNAWLADNVYFNGSVWKLRSAGYASQVYFGSGGDITFKRYPTGSAGGTVVGVNTMQLQSNGNVGIGAAAGAAASKLQVAGGIQMADDDVDAVAAKAGTMRYRTGTEYIDVTGTDLVTNGDFATDTDWTKGTGVTIASGVGTWTNTANNIGLTQLITFTANAYYRCNVTVSNYSSGSLRFRYPGISSPRITANGTYSLIIQADQATNDTLYLQGETNGDANVNFSIDNVSVVEVTEENASYADMCMQTGASTYEWVNIVRNTY